MGHCRICVNHYVLCSGLISCVVSRYKTSVVEIASSDNRRTQMLRRGGAEPAGIAVAPYTWIRAETGSSLGNIASSPD
jgi:hypothetical protein